MSQLMKKDLVMLIMAVALLLTGVFDHSLWTPDEPRVAEIARDMASSGDYLIPHLAKEPFLEQPPLYYAVAGLFWKIFGTANEGFGRLASILFAAGSLIVVFLGTRTLYGRATASLASLILATIAGFFMISHRICVDNALAFFITAALFSFLLAYRGSLKQGYPLFWVCLAGAFLTKGIIGLAIPGVAVALFMIWQRDLALIKRAWVIPGLLVVMVSIAVWGGVLYLKGGTEFLYTFFLFNNLGRFLDVGIYQGGHVKPFYHYLQVIFTDELPWSILLIPAMAFLKRPDERLKFIYCWFLGGFILLSLSSTKRNLYFLPMYPGLAVMVAVWFESMTHKDASVWERRWLFLVATLVGLAGIGLPVAYVKLGGSFFLAACGFLLSALILLGLFRTLAFTLPERTAVGWALLIVVWSILLFPQMDTLKTYKPFFEKAGRVVGKDTVISYNPTETLDAFSSFYGGFFVMPIRDKGVFNQTILSCKAHYALITPRSLDADSKILLESRGEKVLEVGGRARKETQLWRLPAQKGGHAQEAK